MIDPAGSIIEFVPFIGITKVPPHNGPGLVENQSLIGDQAVTDFFEFMLKQMPYIHIHATVRAAFFSFMDYG